MHPSSRPTGPAAFSLVELVLVVAIMGILAAIAVPRFAAASAARRLEVAALRLTADLRHAQQHALASSAQVEVTFDPTTESYTVAAPSPVGSATTYTVNLSESPSHVYIESVTLASNRAVFSGHGLPTGAGAISLRAGRLRQIVTLTVASPRFTVSTASLAP
jgi:prepilin-type N-terminal cleavage/methylation domain-containing protein